MRTRSSVSLWDDQVSVVVDVGPDFRMQALAAALKRIDAVFITHQHADHVMGLDDVRRFSWMQGEALPIWSEASVLDRLAELYPYVTQKRKPGTAVPLLKFCDWQHAVPLGSMTFRSFPVPHGNIPCVGMRIDTLQGSIGYVPDCSGLPEQALSVLEGVDVMILNALRIEPHPSHLSLMQSLEWLEEVGAPQSYLTHMGCPIDYHVHNDSLPAGVEMAWDGLEIEV
ncbi:MBL fold metallo-hydrolase [Kiritimatiellaeota bacterium B1221]|nr:MBL fold metallo-hydrolase [Kiritimatiellaeota bacterium B1221]